MGGGGAGRPFRLPDNRSLPERLQDFGTP
eukprot:COSAG04_NODE_9775_length_833_cov_11.787466_2_plen_28_part_01